MLCSYMSRHCPPNHRIPQNQHLFVFDARKNQAANPTVAESSKVLTDHFVRSDQFAEVPLHKNPKDLVPSAPRFTFGTVDLKSTKDCVTPGWKQLFVHLCEEAEDLFESGDDDYHVDYDAMALVPTPILEPESVLEPTPIREDRQPACALNNDPLLEPLQVDQIQLMF
jgi:hypothetical protein